MPKYFFDMRYSDATLIPDKVGDELSNDDEAWRVATVSAADVLKDIDGRLHPGQGWALDVVDGNRKPLFSIRISTEKHN